MGEILLPKRVEPPGLGKLFLSFFFRKKLRHIGDQDLRSAVWRWMPRLMNDEIATTYILTHTKGKARLLGTKTLDAITGEGARFFFKILFICQSRPHIVI